MPLFTFAETIRDPTRYGKLRDALLIGERALAIRYAAKKRREGFTVSVHRRGVRAECIRVVVWVVVSREVHPMDQIRRDRKNQSNRRARAKGDGNTL